MQGNIRGTFPVTLEPNSTRAVPVKDIMSHLNVQMPFEGSILGTLTSDKLMIRRPFQMNVDYFYRNGLAVTSVHSQGGLATYPEEECQTSFHISADRDEDTFLIIRNCMDGGPLAHRSFQPVISLLNHKGDSQQVIGPLIPPRGVARVSVKGLFPDAPVFLDGKPGNAEVRVQAEVLRSLFYIHNTRQETYCFNHGTEHKTENRDLFFTQEEMDKMGIGTIAPSWLIESDDLHTRVIPCVNLMDGESSYVMDVSILHSDGSLAGKIEGYCTVTERETPTFEMREILDRAGVPYPFHGTFNISLQRRKENKRYPHIFSFITEYYNNQGTSGVQFNSGLFNMPTYNFTNEFQTTKIFSRVLLNNQFSTIVGLINPSGEKGYSRSSDTTIQLIGPDGSLVAEKKIVIPPNGAQWVDLKSFFPDAQRNLMTSNGLATLKVRDRTCRVIGYHFVYDHSHRLNAVDHLFGG